MHRVLSDETSRCVDGSQEFITKKLCISAVFVFAFFSTLGGFLLGKFVSGKHVADMNQPYTDNVNQFLLSIQKLNNATNILQHSTLKLKLTDSEKLQRLFQCSASFEVAHPIFENFTSDMSLAFDQVVNNNLMALQTCYNNISNFLEKFFITTAIVNDLK